MSACHGHQAPQNHSRARSSSQLLCFNPQVQVGAQCSWLWCGISSSCQNLPWQTQGALTVPKDPLGSPWPWQCPDGMGDKFYSCSQMSWIFQHAKIPLDFPTVFPEESCNTTPGKCFWGVPVLLLQQCAPEAAKHLLQLELLQAQSCFLHPLRSSWTRSFWVFPGLFFGSLLEQSIQLKHTGTLRLHQEWEAAMEFREFLWSSQMLLQGLKCVLAGKPFMVLVVAPGQCQCVDVRWLQSLFYGFIEKDGTPLPWGKSERIRIVPPGE